MSIGVGYTLPFEMFAAEWINAEEFARTLNAKQLPGVIFRPPIHLKPYYSVGQGQDFQGVQIYLTDFFQCASVGYPVPCNGGVCAALSRQKSVRACSRKPIQYVRQGMR